ncbi:MAG: hypothetical protein NTX24_04935 [Candidatus Pacearchaeota archaeon]|nr:hypothetical protein [Candidatus Pacearchaeota archaeon]
MEEKIEKKGVKVSPQLLKKNLNPLLKYKRCIEAIYVYGSAVTKKAANDIDVLIVINDSMIPPSQYALDGIERKCGMIEQEGRDKGLIFHFQPLRMLSRWWHLLLDGEPWITSSLKNIIVIYDKKGLLTEVSELVREEILYRKEERAEKLIERSDVYLLKNRHLLLNSLKTLSDAATEAAQILLLFDNKLILNKKKIVEELENHYMSKIGGDIVGNYREIVDLEEKMEKGALSEFSAENLDYYLEKMARFIEKVEVMLGGK